jgi:hypothetical protein
MIMRTFGRLIVAPVCLALSLSVPDALAADGLMITISNDSSDSLFITVYDRSVSPPQQILSHTALYGNASISVSIGADSSGHGRMAWTAITTDRHMHKCGHNQKSHLNDGDTVNVHADSDCAR